MTNYIVEIVTSDLNSSLIAAEGGADRIELCDNLAVGGTTQSFGVIKACREKISIQLFPIIRPRGGDFVYSDEEYHIMIDDIKVCKQFNCDGVVFGLLRKDGSIDVERSKRLVDLAYPMEVTFHRAFDRCNDPFKALEDIIEMGFNRILTSGQKPTAPEGVDLLKDLVQKADDRIIIMPGSGVRKENIRSLANTTGATELHSSLRLANQEVFRKEDVQELVAALKSNTSH